MRKAQVFAGAVATLALFAGHSAKADGGTVVLNTFNQVMPKLIGDDLGPKKQDGSPRVGKNTGVGYMDSQLKIDDSPAAKAQFASSVPLLITATRTDNQAVNANNGQPSYMQGAFAVVNLTSAGPQLNSMQEVDLPRLNGERNWQKPNIVATDKYYLLVAASEDNGVNNNPQVVAFVYDKTTLQPVKVLNTNRGDSTKKPTNLIQLSGKNDGQQYGPHSIARVAENSFVLGVQRNNQNAYVMRVTVDESPATGVNLQVNYLQRVIDNAQHCRPDVTSDGYLVSVEANNQPADIGVRLLKFDLNTGRVVKDAAGNPMSVLVAKSQPGKNKYAVQPNIADLGNYIGVTYQMSEKTRGNGGHTGGSNLSMVQILDKATLKPMGDPSMAVAPYARHAAGTATLWGEEGSEMHSLVSLGGSSTGTGKGFAQVVPLEQTGLLGTKDPGKLYEVSRFSDIAGTIVRGKRNPNDQGRGFIYALGDVPNPGYNGGANAFMPEVKTFMASAVSGYTSQSTVSLAARESIWLSLVPATWHAGLSTTPGQATPTPGTNPDGTGPLPRTDAPATDTSPSASEPGSVIPGGDSPTPPGDDPNFGSQGGGCSVSSTGTSSGAAGGIFLALAGVLLGLRRKQDKKEEK